MSVTGIDTSEGQTTWTCRWGINCSCPPVITNGRLPVGWFKIGPVPISKAHLRVVYHDSNGTEVEGETIDPNPVVVKTYIEYLGV